MRWSTRSRCRLRSYRIAGVFHTVFTFPGGLLGGPLLILSVNLLAFDHRVPPGSREGQAHEEPERVKETGGHHDALDDPSDRAPGRFGDKTSGGAGNDGQHERADEHPDAAAVLIEPVEIGR